MQYKLIRILQITDLETNNNFIVVTEDCCNACKTKIKHKYRLKFISVRLIREHIINIYIENKRYYCTICRLQCNKSC